TYSVTVSGGTCTIDTTIKVTVTPIPTLIVSGNNIICLGSSTTLSASGGNTYLWNDGNTAGWIIVSPSINTSYTVQAGISNCTSKSSIAITVNALPSITITAPQTICIGTSVQLNGYGGNSYFWSTGDNANSISVVPLVP